MPTFSKMNEAHYHLFHFIYASDHLATNKIADSGAV
jgi:hypothetical protein